MVGVSTVIFLLVKDKSSVEDEKLGVQPPVVFSARGKLPPRPWRPWPSSPG